MAGCILAAVLAAMAWMPDALAGITPEEFEDRLAHAEHLNVTAPWQESSAVMDELEPYLDQATGNQYARFRLLEARNRALDGDLPQGLAILERLFDEPLDLEYRVRALQRAVNLATLARRYETAFAHLSQALELVQELGSDFQSSMLHSNAAYIYAQVGEIERAVDYGELSTSQADADGDLRARCIAYQRLGYVYKVKGAAEESRDRYRRALALCQESDDDLIAGVAGYGLADLLREQGEFERSEALFDESMERIEQTGYRSGMAEARLYRARLHKAREEYGEAEAMLNLALDQLEANEVWEYLAEAHEMLAGIARDRGQTDLALEHFQAHSDARERFLDMDRSRHLAFLQVEFDTQFRDQELALLREQAAVRSLEEESSRQQARFRYFGYIMASILVIVLGLLLRNAIKERQHFRRLSRRDGLTKLNNHTRFFELAVPAFEQAQREGRSYTLVLGDIDHFKQVNDRHGHLAGDEVLRQVASHLQAIFDRHGILGRIGGEEFAVALPDWTEEQACELVNQARDRLKESRIGKYQVVVSMSFGVAAAREETGLGELREQADLALYRAKNAGRNRVVLAHA